MVLELDLSTSGLRVGGRFWTSFHQPGSPNSCAPDRKKAGLPTDRQPATVLHQVEVFFLQTERVSAARATQVDPAFGAHLVPSRKFQCRPMKAQMSSFQRK